jgi:hypothetical protein
MREREGRKREKERGGRERGEKRGKEREEGRKAKKKVGKQDRRQDTESGRQKGGKEEGRRGGRRKDGTNWKAYISPNAPQISARTSQEEKRASSAPATPATKQTLFPHGHTNGTNQ